MNIVAQKTSGFFIVDDLYRLSSELPTESSNIVKLAAMLIGKKFNDCGFRDNIKPKAFEIAISFARENRQLAKYIAEQLDPIDVSV